MKQLFQKVDFPEILAFSKKWLIWKSCACVPSSNRYLFWKCLYSEEFLQQKGWCSKNYLLLRTTYSQEMAAR